MDLAADEMGIDRLEIRRRNFIAPEQIPTRRHPARPYDSGDFANLMDDALRPPMARLCRAETGKRSQRQAARPRRRLLLEVTAPRARRMGGLRFEGDGMVTMISGTLRLRSGPRLAFAQIVVSRLGIPSTG